LTLASVNRTSNWSRYQPEALTSHRPNSMALQCPRSVLGAAGLRRFDWARSPAVASARSPTAGGASCGSLAAPGSRYRAKNITRERTESFGASAPDARPQKTGVVAGRKARPDSRRQLEWIVSGFTAKCFWTAAWRWITWLASRLRSQGQGPKALAGSTESVEVFSRRPSLQAAKRN
jgi:hypothetical protein